MKQKATEKFDLLFSDTLKLVYELELKGGKKKPCIK